MKFGDVSLDQCKGAVLAHALALPSGRLKKGHILTAQDLKQAQEAGHVSLIVARLEPDDILENDAATRLGEALSGAGYGLRAEAAFTGRVNLYAERDGLFVAHRPDVDRLNRLDPAITLATLPDTTLVEAGRMVATVKIIPLAVSLTALDHAVALARDAFMLAVHAPQQTCISMVQTVLDTVKPSVLDKTRRLLDARLATYGGHVQSEVRVAHQTEAVAKALDDIVTRDGFDEDRDLVVVFGASAITDEADVIPAAVATGGRVTYFGMPVDPGNLLMVGRFGGVGVVGAPGCARSPAENGFDWVLQRLVHGAGLGVDWISGLGVGGLLMEIHDRPQPRERG